MGDKAIAIGENQKQLTISQKDFRLKSKIKSIAASQKIYEKIKRC